MIRAVHFLLVLFLVCEKVSFSQPEVSPGSCDTLVKERLVSNTEKDFLVNEIRLKDNPGCTWRDRETGFDKKVRRLIAITSLQERATLFVTDSVNLKYYLYPSILLENDSVAFALLKESLDDKAELVSFCSCMVEDDPINIRLAQLYFLFIQLKYYYKTNGTIGGINFPIYYKPVKKRPGGKPWKGKLSQFKDLLSANIPDFEKYLLPSGKKLWN